jgi:hypothetical protein
VLAVILIGAAALLTAVAGCGQPEAATAAEPSIPAAQPTSTGAAKSWRLTEAMAKSALPGAPAGYTSMAADRVAMIQTSGLYLCPGAQVPVPAGWVVTTGWWIKENSDGGFHRLRIAIVTNDDPTALGSTLVAATVAKCSKTTMDGGGTIEVQNEYGLNPANGEWTGAHNTASATLVSDPSNLAISLYHLRSRANAVVLVITQAAGEEARRLLGTGYDVAELIAALDRLGSA